MLIYLIQIKQAVRHYRKFHNNWKRPEILSVRQDKGVKKLEEFRKYLLTINSGNENLTNAISYTLNNWKGLIAYTDDPRLRMGNSDAERAIKPFVIGRKIGSFAIVKEGQRQVLYCSQLLKLAKQMGSIHSNISSMF